MTAEIIKVDPAHPQLAFSRCKNVISRGGVIAYPTDTFYGLGADPKNPVAVKRLFEIKGRKADQPILLLIAKSDDVKMWTAGINPASENLMKTFWPGPLTLVFKAGAEVLRELTAGTGTIGLRVPGNELTRSLLDFLGIALTGTSANVAGESSPQTAEEAAATLGNTVDLILDGGRTAGGRPSTVVDVSTGQALVLREGALPLKDIPSRG
ncbi:MAG TPA: L-threonylcarbamoyladenylate synthase [Nitrospirota bacterium]|nr:L-threonylcarbamoyladenylate synthase [Nitrospirota bacterium]